VSNDNNRFEVKRLLQELALVYFALADIEFAWSGWKKPRAVQTSCLGFNREWY
jgi:hypothetical protein